jgi:hypothetical protein
VGAPDCERCHSSIYGRWKITPMANVVREPDHVVESIIGHVLRRMLKHYSHQAKRAALDRLDEPGTRRLKTAK